MKKIFTLMVAFIATLDIMAQSQGAMTFVGKSTTQVLTANIENAADTVSFKMNGMTSGDITIPAIKYSMQGHEMTIPSFTISGAAFTMDMKTFVATFADQTFTSSVNVGGVEQTITGSSLTGSYSRSTNMLNLTVKFKYGKMPSEATYSIAGYYVKSYTNKLAVSIGGAYNYEAESVTYKLRKYMDGDVEKLDIEVPSYTLTGTDMGDLSIGSYCIKGATYDEAKGGYYRDYIGDGLQMYFSNGSTISGTYVLNSGAQNVIASYNGSDVTIINNFQPGKMPFTITTVFDSSLTSGITTPEIDKASESTTTYNIAGQRVGDNARGIVIVGGKKYIRR